MSRLKLAVLISGGGSNLQAIIDAIESHELDAEIKVVISNRKNAFGLERAQKHNIKTAYIGIGNYKDISARHEALLNLLVNEAVDLVVLAGYLSILSPKIIKQFEKRIINIHPSLIPKYCGEGFYGEHVHEAVILNQEKESGATTHFVDEGVDTGEIIRQERVSVMADDTAKTLAARVLEVEHRLMVGTIKAIQMGQVKIGL
ncbi:phosphoribosylglycinamide formyltransferase [Fusibacter ferrireducens]|uniref:Phosphoribosylglycinamide formyltransferase n=1 Tax=Fusibacter ferrireducens TaxID=2785058 RepID=A0ABR9ZXC5_9FIRM|nr:phosphoribosylglycinamide formyltransferase [Fusibacter ferrireducens]MBF4694606.1 phosphoribosylglycinamide formyltransferase [Fusibacter ferrireducens]